MSWLNYFVVLKYEIGSLHEKNNPIYQDACEDPEGGGVKGVRTPLPFLENHKAVGFIRNTGMEPHEILSFFLSILPDLLASIIGSCALYTPGCRMKAYK